MLNIWWSTVRVRVLSYTSFGNFHNLIKYLEGQGYDVNWNKKKPETPVVKSLQENEEHEPAVPPPETPAQGKDWQLCLQLKIHENDHFS